MVRYHRQCTKQVIFNIVHTCLGRSSISGLAVGREGEKEGKEGEMGEKEKKGGEREREWGEER